MISIVDDVTRNRHKILLDEMYTDRKRMFVDLLKWDVPIVAGRYEKDQFDRSDTTYLIATNMGGSSVHAGSVRLLPTTGPHLLGDVFPKLCASDVPTGPTVWEISRLCFAPKHNSKQRLHIRHQLATGLAEYALLYGVETYTCVAEMSWLTQILSMGWDCEPLGLPQAVDGEMVGAIAIHITPATLRLFKDQWGFDGSLLENVQPLIAA